MSGTKFRTRTLEQVVSPGRPGCCVQVPGTSFQRARCRVLTWPRVGETGYREGVSLEAATSSPTWVVPMSPAEPSFSAAVLRALPASSLGFPACSQSSSDFRPPVSPTHLPTLLLTYGNEIERSWDRTESTETTQYTRV